MTKIIPAGSELSYILFVNSDILLISLRSYIFLNFSNILGDDVKYFVYGSGEVLKYNFFIIGDRRNVEDLFL